MLRQRAFTGTGPARRRRPWPMVSWWFSLLFVVPLALLGGSALRDTFSTSPRVSLRVTDAYTGRALSGVQVVAGDQSLVSGRDGEVELKPVSHPVLVTIRLANYEPVYGQLQKGSDDQQAVALRPTTLDGTITDAQSGKPIPGATISAVTDAAPAPAATTTGADGSYHLTNVSSNARLHVDAGDYGVVEEAIGQRTRIDFKLKKSLVTGVVTDGAGKPVEGAIVRAGNAQTVTRQDGSYRLTGAPDSGDLAITAPGFTDATAPIGAERKADVALKPIQIRALYLSGEHAGDDNFVAGMLDLADRTSVNAVVVDIKEDIIYYDSQVKFFRDAGAVQPSYDPKTLIKKLHDHHLYVIARLVVFKDPLIAEKYPNLAVQDDRGGLWRNQDGVAWVDPFHQELWTANVDLAIEAANLGFDEIQYDYIRFPTDGDLNHANFAGNYADQETRVATIVGFLKLSRERLAPSHVKLAVDIFGIVAVAGDDQGIGQRVGDIAPLVDYVCPMVYPSHFSAGSLPVDGEPNDHPYETIQLSLQAAKERMPGMGRKLRPWLQDFDYQGKSPYGDAEINAEIKASADEGTSGWMMWNAANQYHEAPLGTKDQ